MAGVHVGISIENVLQKKPDLSDMMNLLSGPTGIANKYAEIGIALKVPQNLGLIPFPQSVMQNLATTLQWWIDNGNKPEIDSPVTWEKLIDAIDGPVVDNHRIAEKIRDFLKQCDVYERYLKK